MMMPGEVRVVHSWQLRATTTMVESYDCDSRLKPPELLESTSTPTHPDSYPIVRKLSFGGRSGMHE